MEIWANTNKNELIKNARAHINDQYAGEKGALLLAEDYGGDLATYDNGYGMDLINGSYEQVCKAVYGENPPISKKDWEFKVRDAFSWEWNQGEKYERAGKKRMKLFVATAAAFSAFLAVMTGQDDEFTIENKDGTVRVNAKSALGAYYAYTEGVGNTFFLVNESHNGVFPSLTNFKPF